MKLGPLHLPSYAYGYVLGVVVGAAVGVAILAPAVERERRRRAEAVAADVAPEEHRDPVAEAVRQAKETVEAAARETG